MSSQRVIGLEHSSRHCGSPFYPRGHLTLVISTRFFLHSLLTSQTNIHSDILRSSQPTVSERESGLLCGSIQNARDKKLVLSAQTHENIIIKQIKMCDITRLPLGSRGMRLLYFSTYKDRPRSSNWLAVTFPSRHYGSSRMNLLVNPALKFHVPGLPRTLAFANC